MNATPASNEDALIARYFKPLATDKGALGLVDDAALLNASSDDLVITTDAIVEGVHFLPDDPPETIARKALRVNLSDLAAKGARPAGFVLTLALRDVREEWLAPFAHALGQDARHYECPLLGGDTVSTPGPIMISVTAFGHCPSGLMIRRGGAKGGDRIFVSGTIGDAALGLDILKSGAVARAVANNLAARDFLVGRYREPQPRVTLASIVREYANGAMDVSDGLAGDLTKLCAASGLSAHVDAASIPLSAPARALLDQGLIALETLIAGGDDYEILCTVSENRASAFADAAARAGVAVVCIGRMVDESAPPIFRDAAGQTMSLSRLSYSHF